MGIQENASVFFLSLSSKVIKIKIGTNCIWHEGSIELAKAIAKNQAIRIFSLRGNNIEDEGANAIAFALKIIQQ